MTWTGLSEREIARRLGCDQSYPGKLIAQHDRRPGLEVAHAIERLTAEPRDDGKRWREPPIRTEEWLEPAAKKRGRAGAERAA
jgi:hypothetical protein